jgi:hypothetical protein
MAVSGMGINVPSHAAKQMITDIKIITPNTLKTKVIITFASSFSSVLASIPSLLA